MISSEKNFNEILQLKKTIKSIRIQLIIHSIILIGALISYYIYSDALLGLLSVSLISVLELVFSRKVNRLDSFVESLISSDPEMLRLKANLKES